MFNIIDSKNILSASANDSLKESLAFRFAFDNSDYLRDFYSYPSINYVGGRSVKSNPAVSKIEVSKSSSF